MNLITRRRVVNILVFIALSGCTSECEEPVELDCSSTNCISDSTPIESDGVCKCLCPATEDIVEAFQLCTVDPNENEVAPLLILLPGEGLINSDTSLQSGLFNVSIQASGIGMNAFKIRRDNELIDDFPDETLMGDEQTSFTRNITDLPIPEAEGNYVFTFSAEATGLDDVLVGSVSITISVASTGPPSNLIYNPNQITISTGQTAMSAVPTIEGAGPFTYAINFVNPTNSMSTASIDASTGVITFSSNIPASTPRYVFDIDVTNNAGTTQFSDVYTIVVEEASTEDCSNFTLMISPNNETLPPGVTGTYGVIITRLGGFTGEVTLSLSLEGVADDEIVESGNLTAFTFDPGTTEANSTLFLVIGSTPAEGTVLNFTITGTDGVTSCSAPLELTVGTP